MRSDIFDSYRVERSHSFVNFGFTPLYSRQSPFYLATRGGSAFLNPSAWTDSQCATSTYYRRGPTSEERTDGHGRFLSDHKPATSVSGKLGVTKSVQSNSMTSYR
jgi:hypothetical protein